MTMRGCPGFLDGGFQTHHYIEEENSIWEHMFCVIIPIDGGKWGNWVEISRP
jgi:hypothetical protein